MKIDEAIKVIEGCKIHQLETSDPILAAEIMKEIIIGALRAAFR